MHLWRISNHSDLTGLGGEYLSGRWHTADRGKRIVYLAEHPAVALFENLANLRGDPTFLQDFQLLKIAAPPSLHVGEITPKLTSIDPSKIESTQAIGDTWLASKASALLRVPSIPSPESWNYLFNPHHPEATELKIEWIRKITYDKRLFQLQKD